MVDEVADRSDSDDSTPPARRKWRALAAILWIGVVCSGAMGVVALVWRDGLREVSYGLLALHLMAFMAAVFAYHAGIAAFAAAGMAMLLRRRRLAIVSTVVGLVCVLPEVLPAARNVVRTAVGNGAIKPADSLLIFSANLMYGHGEPSALLAQISAADPDVIVFQEWTHPEDLGSSTRAIVNGLAKYPYRVELPQSDAFGQAVFSKHAFVDEPRRYPPVSGNAEGWGGFREPQVSFVVEVGGRPMRICDVHVYPPVGLAAFAEQRRQVRGLAAWCETRQNSPQVLVGDFNSTSRTGLLTALRAAGMRSAHVEAGTWRGRTWPRVGQLRHAPGVRLDQVLVADEITVLESRTGDDFGSDHRPVIARVGWKP